MAGEVSSALPRRRGRGRPLNWADVAVWIAAGMNSSRRWQLRKNLSPVRWLSGMRIEHVAPDFRSITAALRPRASRGGDDAAHTGAALYALVDPCFLVIVQHAVGPDYLVWDKAGSIEVLAPCRVRVWARLELQDDDLRRIRQMTLSGDKHLHLFSVEMRDADGMAIARIEKMIYVRKRGTST
jgi:hypothetical protein